MTLEQREIAWEYVLLTFEFYPCWIDRIALCHDALRDIGATQNWDRVDAALKAGI